MVSVAPHCQFAPIHRPALGRGREEPGHRPRSLSSSVFYCIGGVKTPPPAVWEGQPMRTPPPLALRISPDMKPAKGVQRKRMGPATSSTWAGRPLGGGEGGGGHVCGDPARGNAVAVDGLRGELGREGLGERDKRAFAGGVVGVEGVAALAGGGGDEDDVAAGGFDGASGTLSAVSVGPGPREHVGGGGLDEAEGAVEIGGERVAPACGGDFGGGRVVRPDAVVDDEDVEVSEGSQRAGDQRLAVLHGGERLLKGEALGGAAELGGEGFGFRLRGSVAEGDAGSSLAKETHSGGADAARASGDKGRAAREGERDAGGGGG